MYKKERTYRAREGDGDPASQSVSLPPCLGNVQADQQKDVQAALRRLPPQHRPEVLDELQARSQSGTVRNVVAYFFALVKRVFAGEFRLWAGRKETSTTPRTAENRPVAPPRTEDRPEPTAPPASRETALAHIANIRKMLNAPTNAGDIAAQVMQARGWQPADNTQLGVAERRYVTNISKAQELGTGLEQVTDVHVRMSLQLQAAFGLRREEAIKFQPSYADRGDHIALKGSWTKGGRERIVPITTAEQRDVLHAAHRLAGTGSLIPADKTFIQQRHVYDGQCKATGLSNMHGLRHQYAQTRYEALTDWKAPAAGGPSKVRLSIIQRVSDQHVRQQISRELGHERLKVTSIYLGA
ncbi:integrase domain-containing protein [Achromobacter xylosoxidans]